ncbi:MAG: hypothetical protein IJ142_00390 [Bacteroidaceae bacterium]|nr:hypothetical protein [Bacteroidaceae bacterium]
MFFSKDNWNNGQEMNAVIPVSSALSFEKVYSSLQAADELYLIPVFGSALMATFRSIYDKEDKSGDEKQLLQVLQAAEANLAYYTNFDALQLRITDQGFQRQQTENFGSPYKYQEDRLRQTFKNRGFNAIDRILDLLDDKFTSLEGYAEMPARVTTRTDIVQRTAEVDRVHFINGSRLVFLRLVPILTAISHNELRPLLGWQLYTKMLKALEDGTATAEVPAASASGDPVRTYEELRQQCIPFVVKKAVAQLLRETGSITDRGLYFIGQAAGNSDNQTVTPATRREAHDAAAIAEAEAQRHADTLLAFIEWKWPEYFSGHQSDVFKRDNNDKKTFWA